MPPAWPGTPVQKWPGKPIGKGEAATATVEVPKEPYQAFNAYTPPAEKYKGQNAENEAIRKGVDWLKNLVPGLRPKDIIQKTIEQHAAEGLARDPREIERKAKLEKTGRGVEAGVESVPGYMPAKGAINEMAFGDEGNILERAGSGALKGLKEQRRTYMKLGPDEVRKKWDAKGPQMRSVMEEMHKRGHGVVVSFLAELALDPLTLYEAGAGSYKALTNAMMARGIAKVNAERAVKNFMRDMKPAVDNMEAAARPAAVTETPSADAMLRTFDEDAQAAATHADDVAKRGDIAEEMGQKIEAGAGPGQAVAPQGGIVEAPGPQQLRAQAHADMLRAVEEQGAVERGLTKVEDTPIVMAADDVESATQAVKDALANQGKKGLGRGGRALGAANPLQDVVYHVAKFARTQWQKLPSYLEYAKVMSQRFGKSILEHLEASYRYLKENWSNPVEVLKTAKNVTGETAASIMESGPARALKRSLATRAKQVGETFDSAMETGRKILAPLQEIHANSGFQRKAWQRIYDDAKPSAMDTKSWDYIKDGRGAKFLNGEAVEAPPEGAKKLIDAIGKIQTEVGAQGKEFLGTKLRKDFGFTRKYLPEVDDALSTQKGPMYEAILKHIGKDKMEQLTTALSSAPNVSARTRIMGSLERQRLLDLPMELPVNGKMVRTYEADLTKVVPGYFEKGASRIEIGKIADQIRSKIPEKDWMPDDVEQIGLYLKRGLKTAEQGHVDTILRNLQGEQTSMGKVVNKFMQTKAGKAVNAVESVIHAKVLSGAGVTNMVSSWPLVQSEIGRIAGMKEASGTLKAFAKAYMPGKTETAQLAENLNAIGRKWSTSGAIETSHLDNVSRAVLDHGTGLGLGNKVADEAAASLISDAMKVIGKDETLLRRFGQDYHLTDAMMAEVKSGNISNKTMHNIMDNFVNRVNPKAGSALDLSLWHKDPLYKRLFPFMTYARAGGNIAADITRAAIEHNQWKPAVLFLGSIYGGAVAETFVKDLATGKIKKEDLQDVLQKAGMRVPLGTIANNLQDLGYSISNKRDLDMTPVAAHEAVRTVNAMQGTATHGPDYAYPVRTSFPGQVYQNVTGKDLGPEKYTPWSPEGQALHKKRSEASKKAALKRKYGSK